MSRSTDIVARIAADGTSTIYVNGARVEVKQLAIVATNGEGCEVTLTLANCTVNHEAAGPDDEHERPVVGSAFKSLCHGCGGLFANGDGHVCE